MGRKNWEEANQKFADALQAIVQELGAEAAPFHWGYELVLATRAGRLWIDVRPNLAGAGASVFARFDDVARAQEVLGFLPGTVAPLFWVLNPHSGKWNHHYFTESIEDASRDLRHELGKVL